jgi:hypothetical protein
VTLSAVTAGGADAGEFERLTGQVGDCAAAATLAATETCTVRVRFDPATTGAKGAVVTVASNAADVTVALSGTGVRTRLSRTPSSLSFDALDVDAGPSAAQNATLTNTGTEPVTLTGVALAGADGAQFERLTGQAGDCAAGTTLTAGQTCTARVRFDPTSAGAKSATLTVSSSVPDLIVTLAATATQAAPPPPVTEPTPSPDVRPAPPLTLTGVAVAPKRFPATATTGGGLVQFVLSRPGTVVLAIDTVREGRTRGGRCTVTAANRKRGKRCIRYDAIARHVTTAPTGLTRVLLDAKALPAGRYRLRVTAYADGASTPTLTARFRIT